VPPVPREEPDGSWSKNRENAIAKRVEELRALVTTGGDPFHSDDLQRDTPVSEIEVYSENRYFGKLSRSWSPVPANPLWPLWQYVAAAASAAVGFLLVYVGNAIASRRLIAHAKHELNKIGAD